MIKNMHVFSKKKKEKRIRMFFMHDLLLKLFLNKIYYLTCISTINIHKTKVYFNSENTKDLNPLRLKF